MHPEADISDPAHWRSLHLRCGQRGQGGHQASEATRGVCPGDTRGQVTGDNGDTNVDSIMSRSVIVTSLGAEEEISCNVHAYPKPSVTWMKVGFVVLLFLIFIFHALIILTVSEADKNCFD